LLGLATAATAVAGAAALRGSRSCRGHSRRRLPSPTLL
jgi:hypothetical protein